MTSIATPVCVAPTGDWCGEGAVWHAGEQSVYWVDINRFLIHRFHTVDRTVKTWFFDQPVTSMILTDRDDTLVAVMSSRVIFWKPATDERRDQGFRTNWPHVRSNDARADSRGSLWLGTMRNNVNPDGSPGQVGGTDGVLYRIDPDGTVTEWLRDLVISNTVTWSPDQKHFYTADTPPNKLYVFDYDASTGAISGQRPFFFGFERGRPDGSCVDSEGYLWNCRYGGHCIVRIAPDGKIDRVIEMPVSNITTCTFGGPDLTTLYVTTAALGTIPSERLAGGLYAIQTDVKGLPENRFHAFGS